MVSVPAAGVAACVAITYCGFFVANQASNSSWVSTMITPLILQCPWPHIWSPPEWTDQPRGYDVSPQATWFPIVSGVAAVADLVAQLSTPPGFGHVYDGDYLDGWARVAPPDGWTVDDTERLEAFLTAP